MANQPEIDDLEQLSNIEEVPPLSEPEAIASVIPNAPVPEDDEAIFNYKDQYLETCKSSPVCAEKLVDEYLKYGGSK